MEDTKKGSLAVHETRKHHGAILAVTCPALLQSDPDAAPENSITTKYVAPKEERERQFAFDYIYGPWLTNEAIFVDIVEPLISELVKGVNCTVLLGGMAGGGGAFSLDGTPNQPGLIWMVMKNLFYHLETTNEDYNSRLAISYFEVSQEGVLDLINYTGKELQVRESGAGGVDISGLCNVLPRDLAHLMDIISEGMHLRSKYPRTSSESHAIFQVQIQLHSRCTVQDGWNLSPAIAAKLVLVNLVKSDNGIGNKEDSTKGRSLLVLRNCLSAIACGGENIPFGESVLTTILKDSLGGSCNTLLVGKAGAAATCKQRFPEWIWSKIVSYLEDGSDFINVSRTCQGLDRIVKGIIAQFRMVLKFVLPYLPEFDILSCIQVSRGVRHEIEKFKSQHPNDNDEARYISNINKAILGPNHDFRTKFVVGGELNFNPDMKLYKIELTKKVNQGQISYSARVSIIKHCCTYDNMENCVWNLVPQLVYRIFKSVPHLRSIRVDGVDECMAGFSIWNEDLENPMPPLSHQQSLSVEFMDQSRDKIYSRLNSLKALIFNAYRTQLLSNEVELMSVSVIDLYRFSYLTSLTLTGINFDSSFTIWHLKLLDAPQLLELTLIGTIRGFDTSDPDPAIYDDKGLSIAELGGKALVSFPRLRVMKLSMDIGFNSPALDLGICCWDLAGDTCKPSQGPAHVHSDLVGEHDQDHHQRLIWWFLPQNLDELQMEWQWSSGFDDGSRYDRYRHPEKFAAKVFKRDEDHSIYGNLESFQGH